MWNKEPELFRGYYYARQGSGKNTKRKSLRTNRLDVATRRLKDLRYFNEAEPVLIKEIWEQYKKEKENKYNALEYLWRKSGSFFGDLRPDQVTRDLCREYQKMRNVKPSTVAKELSVIRAALRWHDKNTPATFYIPPAGPPKNRYLTREEANILLDNTDAPHIRLFIILAISTAARKAALLELQWHQVDFQRGLIDLGSGEGNKGRSIVPINSTLEAALEQAYKARLTDYVIEYRGENVKDIKKGLASAVSRAGLEDVSAHTLRHTAAVWMAENAIPMSEISQYLGHTNTFVTERVYARYSPTYLKKAASALEMSAIEPKERIS